MIPNWRITTHLFEDELLSSWLIRAALTAGCDPLVLTGELWPKWRIWTVDPDRNIELEKLDRLSKVSKINLPNLLNSTLKPTILKLIGTDGSSKGTCPWILPLGSRNRTRSGGLQFCPKCLSTDNKPYYRKNWRLAWSTLCLKHKCKLLDSCPNCKAPISPHQLLANDIHLGICSNCKIDLRQTKINSPDRILLDFQSVAEQVVTDKIGKYGQYLISSEVWFEIIKYFIGLIHRAIIGKPQLITSLLTSLNISKEFLVPTETGLQFELLPTHERSNILKYAFSIMKIDPIKFLQCASENGLSFQTLITPRQRKIEVLFNLFKNLPDKLRSKVKKTRKKVFKIQSKSSVLKSWGRLRRKYRLNEKNI